LGSGEEEGAGNREEVMWTHRGGKGRKVNGTSKQVTALAGCVPS
jgi:hypothetical protein